MLANSVAGGDCQQQVGSERELLCAFPHPRSIAICAHAYFMNRAMQREAATVLRHLTLLTLTRRESGREDAAF